MRRNLLIGLFIALSLTGVLLPGRVAADTGLSNVDFLPQCGDTTLGDWDWGHSALGLDKITSPASWSDFDYNNSSYVILHDGVPTDGGNPHNNRYFVYMADPGHKLTLDQVSGTVHIQVDDNFIRQATIIDEPQTIPAYKGNWTGSFSADQESTIGLSNFTTSAGFTPTIYSGGSTGFDCEFVGHNVNYGPNWGYDHFATNPIHGTGSASTCSALDIPCQIGKLVNGVENTLVSVFTALLNAFSSLFVPDSTQLQTEYNTMSTSLATHLGFLTYPLTFFTNLFNAFTSGSSWCGSGGCVVDTGNLMGHDLRIDFAAIAEHWSSAWTVMVDVLRGLIVLELMLAIRRKFIETMAGAPHA